MSELEELLFDDEIRSLEDIKGSLKIMKEAGNQANDYSELFSYQLMTKDAFERHIESLANVIGSLKRFDD